MHWGHLGSDQSSNEERAPTLGARRPTRVLVAGGDVQLVATYSEILIRHGFNVMTARDGKRAIGMLLEFQPEITVLDHDLPKHGGVEVAMDMLRRRPNSKVILMMRGDLPDGIENVGLEIILSRPRSLRRLGECVLAVSTLRYPVATVKQ